MSSTLHYKGEGGSEWGALSIQPKQAIVTGKMVAPQLGYTRSVTGLGKLLMLLGALIFIAGLVLVLLARTNLPLGRLPGDILYRGKNTTFYFPLATSILLSIVLSLLLYVVSRFRR